MVFSVVISMFGDCLRKCPRCGKQVVSGSGHQCGKYGLEEMVEDCSYGWTPRNIFKDKESFEQKIIDGFQRDILASTPISARHNNCYYCGKPGSAYGGYCSYTCFCNALMD